MREIYLGRTLINDIFLGDDRIIVPPLPRPFIIEVNTDNTGVSSANQFIIPTLGSGYDFEVDWGDGVIETYTGSPGNITHTYSSVGIYDISIDGQFPWIRFNNSGDKSKLINIKQWGDILWNNFDNAFYGCNNLVISATDTPNLSNVTNMSNAFQNCSSINNVSHNFNNWNVSNITNMETTFRGSNFNQPIGDWDVSSVQTMDAMFLQSSFNQPIGSWNVGNVTNMGNMFYQTPFNQYIGDWNVGNVTNMDSMFNEAANFNQNIGNWDTSQVTGMALMFFNAFAFNQDLSGWCVELIASKPSGFDLFANAWTLPKPNWGVAC
jgi:surface protein